MMHENVSRVETGKAYSRITDDPSQRVNLSPGRSKPSLVEVERAYNYRARAQAEPKLLQMMDSLKMFNQFFFLLIGTEQALEPRIKACRACKKPGLGLSRA